jgi:cyclohexanone monooxygenase
LIDVSEFQSLCPPSYFNNEGEEDTKWALFRSWGPGWGHFQAMWNEWREAGDLAGINVE